MAYPECADCPRKPIEITREKMILVEGHDDKNFIEKLLEDIICTDIQVQSMGGTGNFDVPHLNSIKNNSGFRILKSLAIIRDADDNADNAFKDICNLLRVVSLPYPDKPNAFTNGSLKIGILIIPPEKKNGTIEDFCLTSITKLKEMTCIEEFFNCLKSALSCESYPQDVSKARIQAYLSSRKNSVPHLGIAAKKGYFPLDNEVFDVVKQFLKQL